ncbi:MAG TPA: hypothetical protein VFG68_12710 [Fimbriiglobus sp.]|nr:hypothetical protein [Fimbriiglobus sp.]
MGGYVILAATVACGYGDPPLDPAALERRAVEARLTIRSLHVKLTYEREWYDRYGQSGKGGEVKQFEIWLDTTHYRADVLTEGAVTTRDLAVGRRHVLCRNCERPGHSIQYFQGTGGVALMPSDSPLGRSLFANGVAFDPRLLGYTYSSYLNMPRPATAKNLGLDIISPERSPPTVEAATVDGEAAWVLRSKWLRTDDDNCVYLFPGKGGSVGLIENSGKTNGYSYHSRYRSDLEQDARTGIWFPKKFVGEGFVNGALKDRDTVTVHLCEFNLPIDPSVFTLAGIKVADGEEVYDPSKLYPKGPPPRFQYRGGQIVPYQKKTPVEPPPPEAVTQPQPVDPSVVPGRFRWWYAVAAVLFGLAAALLLRRAVWRAA